MQLLDYSQLFIAGCLAFADDFKKGRDVKKMESIARHSVLNSILGYKEKYGGKYGTSVLCCDGRENWRRDFFPHYKGRRKKNKDSSDTDWSSIQSIMDALRDELEEVLPFKVVMYNKAEGDDVIAIITKWLQDNELITHGLEDYPQDIMVVSADHDFRQLYKYPNYHQFNPIHKKLVERPERTFLLEKILIGDSGDGVPNVRSADDHFMLEDAPRQKPITAKMKESFFDNPDGSTLTEYERANMLRNKTLVDFECIPKTVEDGIIEAYLSSQPKGTPKRLFDYFVDKRCRNLLTNVNSFF